MFFALAWKEAILKKKINNNKVCSHQTDCQSETPRFEKRPQQP